MKKTIFPFLFILLLGSLAACGQTEKKEEVEEQEVTESIELSEDPSDYPQLTTEVADNEALVIMNTTLGSIKMKLFPNIAPKTVENFLTHAEEGYYDGVIFHRVINNFMIQGGDPEGTGRGGESIYGKAFEDEFSNVLFNFRGALSMANAGPGTNGSQFFIVQSPMADEVELNREKEFKYASVIQDAYKVRGGTPFLDQKHTVFGQVIEGMDTVDKIAEVETASERPVDDVVIESIEIVQNPAK